MVHEIHVHVPHSTIGVYRHTRELGQIVGGIRRAHPDITDFTWEWQSPDAEWACTFIIRTEAVGGELRRLLRMLDLIYGGRVLPGHDHRGAGWITVDGQSVIDTCPRLTAAEARAQVKHAEAICEQRVADYLQEELPETIARYARGIKDRIEEVSVAGRSEVSTEFPWAYPPAMPGAHHALSRAGVWIQADSAPMPETMRVAVTEIPRHFDGYTIRFRRTGQFGLGPVYLDVSW